MKYISDQEKPSLKRMRPVRRKLESIDEES